MTTKKEAFLASSIASLKLPHHTKVWLIRNSHEVVWISSKQAMDFAPSVSVQDVISRFPKFTNDRDGESAREQYRRSIHYKRVRDLFVQKGLTRLDWIHLPRSTVTLKELKRLSKDELLALPAGALGTMIPRSLEWLDLNDLTVQGLLNATVRDYYHKTFRRGIKKTQDLLRELGFDESDGAFMRINSLRARVEELASRHGLSPQTARKIILIAQAENWIPKRLV